MPTAIRAEWHQRLRSFRQRVPFFGAHDLQVTETMRVVVGAHFALAAIGLGDEAFLGLHGITLYADEFWVDEIEEDETTGVISECRAALSGQAIGDERIVLSWQDVLQSGANSPAEQGPYNVVIHEFTHFLQASRPAGDPAALRLLQAEHVRLIENLAAGAPGILDPYGAQSPEEFLATAAEAFFESPGELHRWHPEVHGLLVRSFLIDPRQW